MDLDELRTFVAVAEAGSVHRAVARLHVSQSALSRRLQRLEASLGVELLDRQAKPLALTRAGCIVLEHCRRVLKAAEDLCAAASPHEPAGEFRIGVAHALTDVALAQPLDELRKAFPRVVFHVTTNWTRPLLEQVRAGALDVTFVALPDGERPPGDLTGAVVGSCPVIFVVSRRAKLPRIVGPEMLADAQWVLNPEGCGFRAALTRMLHAVNVALRVAVEAHGPDLQLSLIARSVGLGLIPAWVLSRSRLRPQLRTFRLKDHDFRLALWTIRGRIPGLLDPVAAALDQALMRKLRSLQ
ncbi:MAG: LysR family transcriptional regulator [Candidatus Rokubacteria bacterium]|nr:LysR family transcriptional regulator [Candidatus Rokubacteria bacterium]MBI4593201.1 LysR family transcriptional regulator [Candidatus Rokubacteria bacterium]